MGLDFALEVLGRSCGPRDQQGRVDRADHYLIAAGRYEKTRRRVDQAIQDLNYRPSMFARGLMLQKSDLVALVLPDVHGECYSEVIRGANTEARELGYHLVISSADGPEDMKSLLEDLNRGSIMDGVAVMVSEQTKGLQEVLCCSRFESPRSSWTARWRAVCRTTW